MPLYPFNPNVGQTIQGATSAVPTLGAGYVAHWSKTPVVKNAAGVVAATTLGTGVTTTVTTGITNPDVARNLSVVGNQATATGNVVVTGTDLAGNTITETIVAAGTTTVVGNKAFATVTQVVFPARGAVNDTISVGVDNKLGLHHTLKNNTVFKGGAYVNNAREGTEPTVAVDSVNLSGNTAILNTAIPGAQVVDIYYIVGT